MTRNAACTAIASTVTYALLMLAIIAFAHSPQWLQAIAAIAVFGAGWELRQATITLWGEPK